MSDRCFACHGPDAKAREAKLRLDRQDDAVSDRDGEAVIVAGDSKASELVARILSDDESEVMPPPEFKKSLTSEEKKLLIRWIDEGAEYDQHWSFKPIRKPAVPSNEDAVDHFVREKLKKRGISPAPAAGREMLLRRITFDLTGLPPTVDELDAFLTDDSPQAYEKVVARLLASDDYAERMAAIWLDGARYADSNGFQFDNARRMWPWRDWVIEAFRKNMPFDRFVVEQLAGDLLPGATHEQKIATGFNRNHPFTIEGGVIAEEYRTMYVNDRTTTAGTLFFGLTLDCARCHDHKFDPISMKEYYQLFAFFNTSADGGIGKRGSPIGPAIKVGEGEVMVMEEKARETRVLNGGQFDQPSEVVLPDTPSVLPAFGNRPRNRLGLANWLIAEENPLLARVTVNRTWQQFFGTGLFKTVDNIGLQGELPSHPKLLDWLAADFRENGWDLHHLIRRIVLSETYRQDSRNRPSLQDPENRLLARGPSFRLPVEMIRDQALTVGGLLSRKIGGPSVKPYQPEGIWEDLNAPKSHAEVYQVGSGDDLYRKSMYTYWRRAAMHPGMAVFDAPNRDVCSVTRATTNTPLQALAMLHDPIYQEAARNLASLILKGDSEVLVDEAFRRVLSRMPSEKETRLLTGLMEERLARYRSDAKAADKVLTVGESPVDSTLDRAELAALSDVCLTILNLSETLTRK
ncbi:MAG: PSD1 and planctomycete cytochrome C domain-containing protein [Akkermansiaceae bacterium]